MAFPYSQNLLPAEVAFLCEMEMITVIPRQRLERLDLLGGSTNALIPPTRTTLPLWLALLLKRQRRVNIVPPPWLDPQNLKEILDLETRPGNDSFSPAPEMPPIHTPKSNTSGGMLARAVDKSTSTSPATISTPDGKTLYLSPPFLNTSTFTSQSSSSTSDSPSFLPYHFFELSTLLLTDCPDDLAHPDLISNLLRDIREVRQAKMRKGYSALTDGSEGVRLDGVGAMEVAESRGFIVGMMAGLSMVGESREIGRREAERERREGGAAGIEEDDEDDEMT